MIMRALMQNFSRLVGLLVLAGSGSVALAQGVDVDAALQAGHDAWQRGDLIGAMGHYHRAAEAGSPEAQAKLGYIYDQSEENAKAVEWYTASAEQGDPDGQFGLGEMYAKGEGIGQDLDKAIEFYMYAAVAGHAQAQRVLANAYEHGALGREIDEAEAFRWLTLAANAGDVNSIRRLAEIYTSGGLGVAPNPAEAERWQRLADAAGTKK